MSKKNKAISKAIEELVALADYPYWYSKNIITWRYGRKLPIVVGKVIEERKDISYGV